MAIMLRYKWHSALQDGRRSVRIAPIFLLLLSPTISGNVYPSAGDASDSSSWHFDLKDALNGVPYDIEFVDITDERLVKSQRQKDGNGEDILEVSSRHGRVFQCHLPREVDEEPVFKTVNAAEKIAADMKGTCLFTSSGWWSYEYCYDKAVKQFHTNADRTKTQVTTLGKFVGTTSSMSGSVTQSFAHGDICDITNKPRQTQVTFRCQTGSNSQIMSIKEPSSCMYEILVVTDVLCPRDHRKSSSILCHHMPMGSTRPSNLHTSSANNGDNSFAHKLEPQQGHTHQRNSDDLVFQPCDVWYGSYMCQGEQSIRLEIVRLLKNKKHDSMPSVKQHRISSLYDNENIHVDHDKKTDTENGNASTDVNTADKDLKNADLENGNTGDATHDMHDDDAMDDDKLQLFTGILTFRHQSGNGVYRVSGQYNVTSQRTTITHGPWIYRPEDFVKISFSGYLTSSGMTFYGVLPECGNGPFTLHRNVSTRTYDAQTHRHDHYNHHIAESDDHSGGVFTNTHDDDDEGRDPGTSPSCQRSDGSNRSPTHEALYLLGISPDDIDDTVDMDDRWPEHLTSQNQAPNGDEDEDAYSNDKNDIFADRNTKDPILDLANVNELTMKKLKEVFGDQLDSNADGGGEDNKIEVKFVTPEEFRKIQEAHREDGGDVDAEGEDPYFDETYMDIDDKVELNGIDAATLAEVKEAAREQFRDLYGDDADITMKVIAHGDVNNNGAMNNDVGDTDRQQQGVDYYEEDGVVDGDGGEGGAGYADYNPEFDQAGESRNNVYGTGGSGAMLEEYDSEDGSLRDGQGAYDAEDNNADNKAQGESVQDPEDKDDAADSKRGNKRKERRQKQHKQQQLSSLSNELNKQMLKVLEVMREKVSESNTAAAHGTAVAEEQHGRIVRLRDMYNSQPPTRRERQQRHPQTP